MRAANALASLSILLENLISAKVYCVGPNIRSLLMIYNEQISVNGQSMKYVVRIGDFKILLDF